MKVSDDFPASVADRPEVDRVVVFSAQAERRFRIVQLCNWHLIPRESFEAVLKADGVDDEEIRRRFAQHEARVESVQAEQRTLMLFLVEELQLKAVHLEGLCAEDAERFTKQLQQLRAAVDSEHCHPSERSLAEAIRQDRLLAGTAGQLSMDGILRVLPVEDRAAFEAASPFRSDGTCVDDPKLTEQREQEIVRHLLHDGTVTFVILGGLHDLSDKVPPDCEYVRIETKRYVEFTTGESRVTRRDHSRRSNSHIHPQIYPPGKPHAGQLSGMRREPDDLVRISNCTFEDRPSASDTVVSASLRSRADCRFASRGRFACC